MNKLIATFFVVLTTFVLFIYAKSEYKWEKDVRSKQNEIYKIIYTLSDLSFLKPWTIFNAPASSIFFADKNSLEKIYDSLFNLRVIVLNKTKEDYDYFLIIDTINNKNIFCENFDKLNNLKNGNISPDMWQNYVSTTFRSAIESIIIDKFKSYKMLDVFGDEIDITDSILSGKYSIIESINGKIITLKKNNVYNITNQDVDILKKILIRENISYLNLDKLSKIDTSYFSYSHSYFETKIQDVYTLKIRDEDSGIFKKLEFIFLHQQPNINKQIAIL